ncbi:hypothetical protein [Pararhizobium qamdonense]|uniref:hypothetical protein n=1 Tax=Pararhizobium qamdonense TaxID=3031126 RepID=UPI0023E1D13D|nr:hypothetical protein [Pararhizobium qamdonense]
MTSSLSNAKCTGMEITLPRMPKAGPEFFATNSVSQLNAWPQTSLSELGVLPFPMQYDQTTDRYTVSGWSAVLAEVAHALLEADEVVITGNHEFAEELDSLQIILSNCIRASVKLHTPTPIADPLVTETRARRVSIVIGVSLPVPATTSLSGYELVVCMCDTPSVAMFSSPSQAIALPVTSDGWRLSHVAFHRLLDIESEQSASYHYEELFEDTSLLSRPLCSVIARLLRQVKIQRESNSLRALTR